MKKKTKWENLEFHIDGIPIKGITQISYEPPPKELKSKKGYFITLELTENEWEKFRKAHAENFGLRSVDKAD